MTLLETGNNFREIDSDSELQDNQNTFKNRRNMKILYSLIFLSLVFAFGCFWFFSLRSNKNFQKPITHIPNINLEYIISEQGYAKFETGEYGYMIITNEESFDKFSEYRQELSRKPLNAGTSLRTKIEEYSLKETSNEIFINLMLSTKIPFICAENYIPATNSDWTIEEVELLGEINIAMPVKIYDNGQWINPVTHHKVIDGYLLFTPGVLMKETCQTDYRHIVDNGKLDLEKYYNVYERRLLPLLTFAHQEARGKSKKAVVTIPGIGCGCFADKCFKSDLSVQFGEVIKRILENHGKMLSNISLIYFDQHEHPNVESEEHKTIEGIDYLRYCKNNTNHKNLLEDPKSYGDKYADDILFAFVAWDHLSFPGNDYFTGSRWTDDGVKAAATSSMTSLLQVPGQYFKTQHRYYPASQNNEPWRAKAKNYQLNIYDGGLYVFQKNGNDLSLKELCPIGRKFFFS